jgi:delta 1-pyrroline-5-carboxylate dehydrogenase
MFRSIRRHSFSSQQLRLLSNSERNCPVKNTHLWNPTSCFINGKFVHHDYPDRFSVYNPATGEEIASLPKLKVEDVVEFEQVAWDSWHSWKKTTSKERSKILRKMSDLMHHYADDLAHIITLEAGKPLSEARGEVLYAASFLEFYGEEAKRIYGEVIPPVVHGRKYLTMKQPVGPAAMITPWNFPSAMITRKVLQSMRYVTLLSLLIRLVLPSLQDVQPPLNPPRKPLSLHLLYVLSLTRPVYLPAF